MRLLEERIRKNGEILDNDVLEIDSFLNHQAGPELIMRVGAEFKRLFGDEKITKVLTCGAPGIAPGIIIIYRLSAPMIFARKKKPSTPNDAVYWASVFSYTKKINNKIYVEKRFLSSDDRLLITGNFLTHGEAAKGILNIAKQADASIAGADMAVAKEFQSGSDWAKEHGYRLEALAKTASFENNQAHFVGEK